MNKMITIKPKEGMVVRDPITKQKLPAAGLQVLQNSYWTKKLRDGDIVLVSEKQSKPEVVEVKQEKYEHSKSGSKK